ncbi:hypothetical protein [Chryseobacterium oryctis]|uniref:Uncharacterized protein n=1 Tax=Chryseobacterium oryctis TaxID=2952618 RepID=A0ABT3HSN4_9FLAO|nr:hypothetical protein [Chryseobacterium oryctis]MCW3162795.1 hypothetical protein [Chryseobacterium oryctis]
MSNILAGLFEHRSDYKKLETDLENSGFQSSDYIIYIQNNDSSPHYLASVSATNNEKIDSVKNIFSQNSALKIFLFENMSFEQTSYQQLKNYIDARSKAEIQNSPDLKIKVSNIGIDSAEVKI